VGLLLGGLLLGFSATWFSRMAGVAALVVGLVLSVVITPTGLGARYRVDAAAQRLVCADGTPQVCVTAVHAYELAEVTPAVRRALTLLAKLPDPPTRAVEWRADAPSVSDSGQYRGQKPKLQPGTVMFRLEPAARVISAASLFTLKPDHPDLVASIVNGAGTTMNGCELGDPIALAAAGAWLMGVDVLPLGEGEFDSDADPAEVSATVAALRKLPEQEQVRRVSAVRDAANACRTGDLRSILTGRATS
jgi:hypothetical protein